MGPALDVIFQGAGPGISRSGNIFGIRESAARRAIISADVAVESKELAANLLMTLAKYTGADAEKIGHSTGASQPVSAAVRPGQCTMGRHRRKA